MDMKKILQAVDAGSSKSASHNDEEMKRFVSIIAEGRGTLNRLTQAESTVINHYSKKEDTVAEKPTLSSDINKYFEAVEQEKRELSEQINLKKKEKAQQLAERAIAEIGGNYGHFSKLSNHLSKSKKISSRLKKAAMDGTRLDSKIRKRIHREDDEIDAVTLDIPLFLRLLEYAKEDAKSDMDLHNVTEKAIELSKQGGTLSMNHYSDIVGNVDEAHGNSKIYDKCWTGYKKVPGKQRGEPGSCKKK